MTKIRTEKELADAMKRGDEYIEIEGDLVNKVVKIRAVGKVSWAVAIGAIGLAVYGAVVTLGSGGAAAPAGAAGFGVAPAAIAVLGTGATYSAIAIAIAAGGVGVLTSLRGYVEVENSANKLVLKKK